MSDTEAALIAAIEAAPDDDAPRMVYADWLLQRGDLRGQLIQIQTERRRDPYWSRDRLELREARLLAKLPRPRNDTPLFDRGEYGLELHVADHGDYGGLAATWVKAVEGYRYSPAKNLDSDIAAFVASELLRHVRRLDLSEWRHETWLPLLASAARPRHLVLPPTREDRAEALRDAPLLERVERLELRATCDDKGLATLLTAPWAKQLVHLSLSSRGSDDHAWVHYGREGFQPISDDGIETLARTPLPSLRVLDARFHRITARGIAALASSPLALEELRLSADRLDLEAFALLDRSRLAPITRTSLAGPWLTSPELVVALVRSPTWRGALDLLNVPHLDEQRQYRDLQNDVLAALALVEDARPLRALRMGIAREPRFFESPIARSLAQLATTTLPPLGASPLRLESLYLRELHPNHTAADLAIPALQELRRLAINGVAHQAHALNLLADSRLRPVDLFVRVTSKTGATAKLLRSPVLERVVDLTLALDGNHGAKVVGNALLDTPYLQHVQHLELRFLSNFPSAMRARIEARYGAVLGVA